MRSELLDSDGPVVDLIKTFSAQTKIDPHLGCSLHH